MSRWLRRVERTLFTAGVLLVGFVAMAYVDSVSANRAAMAAFDASLTDPNQGLWSEKRRADYAKNADADLVPAAVLRIPSIDVEAPVFSGTDKVSLNRGVGHVAGTETPGATGNVALAGHRDSYFRALKDVEVGSTMEIETLGGTDVYRITDITIVDPLDVEVLEPTDESVLTLITCYPFYYVGYAPDRYIVRGVLETRSLRQPAESRGEPSVARGAGPRQESTGSLAIDEGDD